MIGPDDDLVPVTVHLNDEAAERVEKTLDSLAAMGIEEHAAADAIFTLGTVLILCVISFLDTHRNPKTPAGGG